MTPELLAVYDELVARASRPPHAERSRELRARFLDRCGRLEADHPAAATREAAAWEDAMVRGGLLLELAAGLSDPAERDVARALARSQRGVFVFEHVDHKLLGRDLWSRAEFVLAPRDAVGKDIAYAGVHDDSPPCQARVLATVEGAALLPGTVFHPAGARAAMELALNDARARGLETDRALDALLRMEHAFQTMSRGKVAYAYRAEAMR
jgi:hypothetical protein